MVISMVFVGVSAAGGNSVATLGQRRGNTPGRRPWALEQGPGKTEHGANARVPRLGVWPGARFAA